MNMLPNFAPQAHPAFSAGLLASLALIIAGCSGEAPSTPADTTAEPQAAAQEKPQASEGTGESMAAGQELPVRVIPNVPSNAEAYYAPDNLRVIAQTQDKDALVAEGRHSGSLTYTFTDTGEELTRINDHGQDACSYFFPENNRLVYTSTRDNMDMPVGNWSDSKDYPQGAELYIADLDGSNVKRLTNNKWYEAEVSISPDGEWIVFGRQIDGEMDLWRMRPDGSDEEQITFTENWQEGAPFYLPDSETILTRAWKRSDTEAGVRPTPMTVSTVNAETKEIIQRTFDGDMNWAPYPAPDGRHYVFVRIVENNNWEVFLGDLAGGEPVRLTYNEGFDGFPALSPDGTKMLFARSTGDGFMSGLTTFVMDVSSLNLGPENWTGSVAAITPPE
jgi:dipeptidyl aminopeptidase/acylaminoacyl peptidase